MSRSTISRIFAALACAAVLSWGHDVAAASRGGSGSRSGGSHSGSRSGTLSSGSRSGTYHGGSHSGGGGHSGGSHSGGHHGGYYGGHYGGYYGGYYPGWWYPGFGWGYYGDWGWGWGWGYGPWYGYGHYGYPYYGYGDGYRRGRYGEANFAVVKTDVEPDEAALYLDGKLIGTADDFDGYPDTLYLGSGHYHLEFRLDGYENYSTDIDASPGRFFRLEHRLTKIPGAKHYGTYEPARPEGGVVRYFEKRRRNDDSGSSPESWRGRPRGDRQELYREDEPYGRGPEDDADAPEDSRDQAVTSEPVPPESPNPTPAAEARIVFDVSPGDAAVYVDGHFAGSARELNGLPEGLAVSAGEHRVVVTCPGYREATTRIQASGDRIGRAAISLKQ